jgi:hypothetical protein
MNAGGVGQRDSSEDELDSSSHEPQGDGQVYINRSVSTIRGGGCGGQACELSDGSTGQLRMSVA